MEAISCLRELDRRAAYGNLTGFDSTHTAGVYLRSSRRFVHPEDFRDWGELDRWIAETHPDWIVAYAGFASSYGVTDEQFMQRMRSLGYGMNPCLGEWPVTVYTAPPR
jgi:hypothetical protein